MTIKNLLTVLATLAGSIPAVGPPAQAIIIALAGLKDDELALLDAALANMPTDAAIDAGSARVYAEALAKKLQEEATKPGTPASTKTAK